MIRITDARLNHIDAIEAMEKQCFSVPWTREMLIKQLPDDMHIFLAAEDDDEDYWLEGKGWTNDESAFCTGQH